MGLDRLLVHVPSVYGNCVGGDVLGDLIVQSRGIPMTNPRLNRVRTATASECTDYPAD